MVVCLGLGWLIVFASVCGGRELGICQRERGSEREREGEREREREREREMLEMEEDRLPKDIHPPLN